MYVAIGLAGDSNDRSIMEASGCGCSPAKEPSRSFWRRKTNIFVAMPTLLLLYFTGAGIAFIIWTRTFVSFHNIFSHTSQAPEQLFRINSTYFTPVVVLPEKPALEVVEELQAPAHTLHDERGVDTATADAESTARTSSSQPDLDPVAEHQVGADNIAANDPEELDAEPEFMQMPSTTNSKQVRAVILQRRLQRMSSAARRRWLRQNWSIFNVLKDDNLTNQFNSRMRAFMCPNKKQTPHLATSSSFSTAPATQTLHKRDETSICCNDRDPNAAFCTQRFFLTWMSPAASFSSRERLGLESIFKHNPEACVVLLSRTMDSNEGRTILAPFQTRGYRITAVTPDLKSLFAGTPAAKWLNRLRDGTRDPGCINLMQNLSNVMRLAALYKYGGVYVDTDVVVLKSFAALRNAVGAQSKATSGRWSRLNNAVLVFDRAHPVVRELLREFVATFDGNRWGWNGPYLVSRVVHKVQTHKWANCSNVAVLPLQAFYPVNWIGIVRYFQKPTAERDLTWQARELQWINQGTYSIHLWNKRTNHLTVQKGSIMESLFKRSCLFCKQAATS